jgi:putative transposase
MSCYTKLTNHVVFSTRYRRPTITQEIQERLYEYIGGIIRAKNGHLIEIGGVADHIHILATFPAAIAVADMVRDIKAISATWTNESGARPERFEWQKGCGAFTVVHRTSAMWGITFGIRRSITAPVHFKMNT